MGGLGGLVLPSCFSAPFTKARDLGQASGARCANPSPLGQDAEAPSRAPCELEKRLKAFFDSVAAEWGPSLPLVQARP